MTYKRSLVAVVAVFALFLAGCGSSSKKSTATTAGGSTTTGAAGGNAQGSGGNAVEIKDFAFNPSALNVSAGTKVTWTNNDSTDHTTTSQKGPASFDSGHLGNGKTFSFTFAKKGTYQYHCSIHNSMTGSVVVS